MFIRTIEILERLGFYIKMYFTLIESFHMTITLTNEKKQKISNFCIATRLAHTLTIRELAKLIGNLVAVPYVRLFYRQFEKDKIKSLQQNKGDLEAKITVSDLSKKELTWSENNIMTATKSLKKLVIYTTIHTDASLEGEGVVTLLKI